MKVRISQCPYREKKISSKSGFKVGVEAGDASHPGSAGKRGGKKQDGFPQANLTLLGESIRLPSLRVRASVEEAPGGSWQTVNVRVRSRGIGV